MAGKESLYEEDILHDGFECREIGLEDDYEGRAVSVLIRRVAGVEMGRAVLYVHGFNDYFFQKELGVRFNEGGYRFYVLDLRKYGRAWLPHQTFNDMRDVRVYFEEIAEALRLMRDEGCERVVLMGHSTGGLIVTLFAKEGVASVDGLILNSPFFDFNKSRIVKAFIPWVAAAGKCWPGVRVPGGFTEEYGKFLHRSERGEWDYVLAWKPHVAPGIRLGWIRAIYLAQRELRRPFPVACPVLVLHSGGSVTDFDDEAQLQGRDAILDVRDIARVA